MGGSKNRSLAVVIGAGASHDCIAHEPENIAPEFRVAAVDPNYRPPLAKELFAFKPAFNQILDNYPLVSALSEEIRSRLRRNTDDQAVTLEQILRELEESPTLETRRQVWEVPLYLQELLWTISDKYVQSGSSKFSTFVRRIMDSSFERILFFTLNYDLFLDRAITAHATHSFTTMDSYSPSDKKWTLVKAHGSVNWARYVTNWSGPSMVRSAWFDFVGRLNSKPEFSGNTEVLHRENAERHVSFDPEFRSGQNGQTPLYPWMALPAEGEKDFFCPNEQIGNTKRFFNNCHDFLFIGFSGLDPHVLELFREVSRVYRLMIVCGGKDHSRNTLQRLFKINTKILPSHQFGKADDSAYISDLGFAEFVESEDFRNFLNLD